MVFSFSRPNVEDSVCEYHTQFVQLFCLSTGFVTCIVVLVDVGVANFDGDCVLQWSEAMVEDWDRRSPCHFQATVM